MEQFDVIILGAGPAGLKCAELLGGTDLQVAVYEKSPVVGPKECAGGITSFVDLPGDLLKEAVSFNRHYVVLNGKRFVVEADDPLRIIDRTALAEFQLGLLKDHSNVKVKMGRRVVRIVKGADTDSIDENQYHERGGYIVTSDGERAGFDLLVGADGSQSLTRKFLGLESRYYIGAHYRIPFVFDRVLWYLNPEKLGLGYCWLFPHSNFTSCGVYFDPDRVSYSNSRKVLCDMLDEYGLDYRGKQLKAFPVNCLYSGFKFDNIYLCGDAAGLAFPLTGEGISTALVSGAHTARDILGARDGCGQFEFILRRKKKERFLMEFNLIKNHYIQSLLFRLYIYSLRVKLPN
ncbi:MAG TPA: NAD(P)/FAD-dependent oxidoreductase [Candidatus Krumholzibacteriaceae bacterium]|nr:NAD(P)/FAD-dependent oxidoreductase [Candidatus Krumholzibacteriaceae bacterium]